MCLQTLRATRLQMFSELWKLRHRSLTHRKMPQAAFPGLHPIEHPDSLQSVSTSAEVGLAHLAASGVLLIQKGSWDQKKKKKKRRTELASRRGVAGAKPDSSSPECSINCVLCFSV